MIPKVFRNVLKHCLNCFIDLIETETNLRRKQNLNATVSVKKEMPINISSKRLRVAIIISFPLFKLDELLLL